MRMNKTRMEKVAKYAIKNGITKTVKEFLDTNEGYCYSFKESQKIMRNAVRKAVRWFKGSQRRKAARTFFEITNEDGSTDRLKCLT